MAALVRILSAPHERETGMLLELRIGAFQYSRVGPGCTYRPKPSRFS
ncbi:MAG TPA: hypothetical protein VE525_04375 [Rubrobacter sp.]|nr:hypothetical protein [Rubrobacter sp.]